MSIAVDGRSSALAECIYKSPVQVFDVLWNGNGKWPTKSNGKQAFRIQHRQSQKCMAIARGNALSGNGLELVKCVSGKGQAAQNWRGVGAFPTAQPLKSWKKLTFAGSSSFCLSNPTKKSRKKVSLQPCQNNLKSSYDLFNDGSIRHTRSGKCLLIPEGGRGKTAALLDECTINSPKQTFKIDWNGKGRTPKKLTNEREFRIRHESTNLCLGAQYGKWEAGNKVVLRKCARKTGHVSQNWRFLTIKTQ